MKGFNFIICTAYCLYWIQTGCVGMGIKSIFTHLNTSIITNLNTAENFMTKPQNSNSILINLNIPKGCVIPTPIRTNIDIISLFSSQTSLAKLTLAEKKSAILVLTSNYDLISNSLPPIVIANLVTIMSSCNQIFSNLSNSELNSVLIITTSNQYYLHCVHTKILIPYLKGLFSLSPCVLNTIPKSVIITILSTISSSDILNELPKPNVIHLITVISMSKSLFNCLPLQTLVSLLTFIADKSHKDTLTILPPSTLFAFVEGLLDTINDSSGYLLNKISVPILVNILGPMITSQMLSVLPIRIFDLLLSVLGSSNELSNALSIKAFITIFNTISTSPLILNSLNPIFVAQMLTTVTLCPSIVNNIPLSLVNGLKNSLTMYSPSALNCLPINTFNLLLSQNN